ncbi:hypothetical protein ACFLUY_02920 [Chloroflexota bacterium]
MKKISIVFGIVILLSLVLTGSALAASLETLCRVDIGDTGSEDGHDVTGWGIIEPGMWWNGDSSVWGVENARVVWDPVLDPELSRCAYLAFDRHIQPGAARAIRFRHLEGLNYETYEADGSFDMFVRSAGSSDWGDPVYQYIDQATGVRNWLEVTVDITEAIADENANIEVKICATAGSTWKYFYSDWGQVVFDWIELLGETPKTVCGECKGKVNALTLQNNGTAGQIEVTQGKKDTVVVFSDVVPAGGQFYFIGQDKKGTLGTKISILVDGKENIKIHTSCSKPIGIGSIFGDFEVIDGSSRKGGKFCPIDLPDPPDSSECEGKVTTLTLRNNGDANRVVVMQKKGEVVVFNDDVPVGGMFTFTGQDKKGTLGTEIIILVGGEESARIHTSCSQPISIGMMFGNFEVIDGASLKGGNLGP